MNNGPWLDTSQVAGTPAAEPPIPLARWLRRGHWQVALVAVMLVGLLTSVASMLVLRSEVERSLDLVARTSAYAVEAAVAFRDGETAHELITAIAEQERLASIEIVLRDGDRLAVVRQGSSTGDRVVAQLLGLAAAAPVRKDGQDLAEVRVRSDASVFERVLGGYLLGVVGAMALTAAVVVVFSRRMERELGNELDRLGRLTRTIRENREFFRRAPAARVAEIDALAEDFNALLAEVQAHEAEMLARQARLRSDNQTLWERAAHDTLTGLPNRGHFSEQLQQAIDRAGREGGHRLGLLFIDVDRFKQVNDEHGHAVGDQLLVEIARRVGSALRESDVVGRLGGDEFAVLIDPLRHLEDVHKVVTKVDTAVSQPMNLDGGRWLEPRVSIGLSLYPDNGTSADELLATADRAMYVVKRTRRDNSQAA